MTAPFDAVLERLDVRVRNGTTASAICPAHPDKSPSLSVSENGDGNVLVHCHAGCTVNAVADAIGMSIGELFAKPAAGSPAFERRIAATYDYTDAAGELLYQVVRFEPKDFRQRRPDGNGGWIWKLGDMRRVLYRLPEVIAAVAAGRTVFVAEGEKDVEALAAAGYIATCNPQGAGKWGKVPAAPDVLAGADVIIVADADRAGRAHAADVARSLTGKAASVTVAEPAIGKDAAEHLGAGRTVDELVVVAGTGADDPPLGDWLGGHAGNGVQDADAGEPVPGDTLPAPIDWHALYARTGDVNWLVEDVWPAGRQLHIFAARKTGKSLVALWIAACLAAGRDPFTGRVQPRRRVGYLDYEMTEDDLLERCEEMGFTPDDLAGWLLYYLWPTLPALDTDNGGRTLLRLIERDQAEAVVIDTVSRVVEGEENSADTFRAFFSFTGMRLKRAGISLVRLDHEGHEAGRSRGSSAKADDVDVVWRLQATDDGLALVKKAARMSWVPERVDLHRTDPLGFRRVAESWPAGTAAKAAELDDIGAPVDITKREARQLLTDNGRLPGRNDLLLKAIAYRRSQAGGIVL